MYVFRLFNIIEFRANINSRSSLLPKLILLHTSITGLEIRKKEKKNVSRNRNKTFYLQHCLRFSAGSTPNHGKKIIRTNNFFRSHFEIKFKNIIYAENKVYFFVFYRLQKVVAREKMQKL
jgi:hypothetical protein